MIKVVNGRSILLITALVLLSSGVFSQEISVLDNNPTFLKWKRIRTPHFNVLFNQGSEEQAQRLANTLEHIREPESYSLSVNTRKFPFILQSQSSTSNGFVTMAPMRSEFFSMPPQNYNFIGTNDWLSLLASHEFRHTVQYSKSITGFNKLLYYVFGQQALSLVSFTAVPQWFWEGDAVATETAFTNSGRGRIPNFNLVFRTNLLEGRSFNYHKQYLRSFKHNIPDHYVLGYHMISYLRKRQNDPLIWEKVVNRAWSYPFIPFTFSRSIRKEIGIDVTHLYREMANNLQADWQKQVDELKLTEPQRLTKHSAKAYTDYFYPQAQPDGSVIAMKNGIGTIPQIVRIGDNGETRLSQQRRKFVVGPWNDGGLLSTGNNRVVWNEYRYDPRWRVKTYSVIKSYDMMNNRARQLTHRSRFSSAAISPDGKLVATVESKSDYEMSLKVIDFESGEIVKTFENPEKAYIAMPRWSSDSRAIVATRLIKGQKFISRFDYQSGQVTDLMSAGTENVGYPVLFDHYLIYNSPYSGIDNIYALDLNSNTRFQITSAKYGAYNPSVSDDGSALFYNDQTRDGMAVAKIPFDPATWVPIERITPPATNLYDHLVEQEHHPDIMKDVPNKAYPVEKYPRLRSMLNIHSWGPYFNTSVTQADFGISSQNILSTMVVNAGYFFDINERTGSVHVGASYQGLYPILDVDVLSGKRQTNTGLGDREVRFTWNETTTQAGVRIPLQLTNSKLYTSVTFKNSVGITDVTDYKSQLIKNGLLIGQGTSRQVAYNDSLTYVFDNQVGNGRLLYNLFAVSFTSYLKVSRRDFNPKWGQLIDVELYSTPYGGSYQGKLNAVRGAFYFPGFAKHHSILIRGGYQDGTDGFQTNRYSFRNRVFRPRGFSYPHDTRFQSLSVNYALPIWYPDIAIGPLLNIQRLRANFFYDWGQAGGSNYFYSAKTNRVYFSSSDKAYASAGAEFTVDVNVMRLLPRLDIGVRVTRGITQKETLGFEFLLGSLNL